MTLPVSAGRLSAITGYLPWRRAVERLLVNLDARVSRTESGTAVVWLGGGTLPAGLLAASGGLVLRADYPALFAAIGTTYNTGGETGTQFRLPNMTPAPPVGVWAVRT